MRQNARGHPLSGAVWTWLSYIATRSIGLAATAILARLLYPHDFGTVALALVVLLTVGMFGQLGLPSALVLIGERRDAERGMLTVLILVGVADAAIVAALATPLSELFSSPRLATVLVVMAPILVFSPITQFYDALLQRQLAFRARTQAQVAQALAAATIGISVGIAGGGIWSLVAAQLVAQVAYLAALIQRAPYFVAPGPPGPALRHAWRPARGFLATDVLSHAVHNLDVGVIGYVLGSRAVGYYSMAFNLADLPYQGITNPLATTAFPIFARAHRERTTTSELALELIRITALLACPTAAIVSAAAHPLIVTLFGGKWGSAAGTLAILGAWSLVSQIGSAVASFLTSVGRAAVMARIYGVLLIPFIPLLVVGARADGIQGVAWVTVGNSLAAGIAVAIYARARLSLPLRRQLHAIEAPLIGCAGAWVAARAAVSLLSGTPDVVALVGAVAAGAIVYLILVRVSRPAALRQGFAFLAASWGSLRAGEASSSDLAP